jgi:hypothetical protein
MDTFFSPMPTTWWNTSLIQLHLWLVEPKHSLPWMLKVILTLFSSHDTTFVSSRHNIYLLLYSHAGHCFVSRYFHQDCRTAMAGLLFQAQLVVKRGRIYCCSFQSSNKWFEWMAHIWMTVAPACPQSSLRHCPRRHGVWLITDWVSQQVVVAAAKYLENCASTTTTNAGA